MSPRPRSRTVDTATLDLFDERPGDDSPGGETPGDASLGGKPPGAVPPDTNELLALLRRWADAGLLRRLDAALASFVAGQDAQAGPALLVAAALLAQMEGRGHSCLPLAPLAGNPNVKGDWFIHPKTNQEVTFVDFARSEGRFVKHFDKDGNPSETLLAAKQDRLENWHVLQELAGLR